MGCIELKKSDSIATLVLNRGKVNALNGVVVDELRGHLNALEDDSQARSVILTGSGKFFSFGFDIPEFLSFTKDRFAHYLTSFTGLYNVPLPLSKASCGRTQRPHDSRWLHVGLSM